jgi:competence protein ComEC
MAGTEDFRPRAKAWAAGVEAARRRAGVAMPEGLASAADAWRKVLRQWALAEVAPGRLFPWLPVAFGFGIIIYFTAEREPAWWAAVPVALAAIVVAVLSRRHTFAFPLALGIAAIAGGFAVATVHTARIAHPVLQFPVASISLSGFVETREERERSDRIVVRVQQFEGRSVAQMPDRVRVAVRKNTAPAVGSFVELKAHLSPPLAPLLPGGYDFARDMFFQRIGASGYALGKIHSAETHAVAGFWLRYASFIDRIRETIDDHIRTVLKGDRGSIASALITGKRDAITTPVNEAMYVSSLAHVLSISGYHMAVVTGIVFFIIRAGLALVPSLASRRPIKKWAACGAFVAAAFYLLLSGAEVATQRSFIMIAIVLIGVVLDRPAITFRTHSIAALCVLFLIPESVLHPSFQMSFAATLALVAGYQQGMSWAPSADSSLAARVALWGAREIIGLILASLVAGLATTPYAAYHFHRIAPYGLLANLLAMPVVSLLVMPMGILGLLMMPFGFDAIFWQLMGQGIDWMIAVVLWVAGLPGAVGRIHAFGSGPLLLATAGLLVICLLRTSLRWSGAILMLAASLWAVTFSRPDVLISSDGQTAAFRTIEGRLSILRSGRDKFALKEWLAADADGRAVEDVTLRTGVQCDATGCIGELENGRLISIALAPDAFEEDCERAAVVVSPRDAPGDCKALFIDRAYSQTHGATALRWVNDRFEETTARSLGYDRPWAKGIVSRSATISKARSAPRNATPRTEDLESDD